MKRFLVVVFLVAAAVTTSPRASAAAAVIERTVPSTWVVSEPGQPIRVITLEEWERLPAAEKSRAVWGNGFRVKAMRAPDGWLEAREAAMTITPGQVFLGIALGLMMLLTIGGVAGTLILFIRPRTLSWFGTLTRRGSREMLGRL